MSEGTNGKLGTIIFTGAFALAGTVTGGWIDAESKISLEKTKLDSSIIPLALSQKTEKERQDFLNSYRRAWRTSVVAFGLDNRIVSNGAPPSQPLSVPPRTPDSSIPLLLILNSQKASRIPLNLNLHRGAIDCSPGQ